MATDVGHLVAVVSANATPLQVGLQTALGHIQKFGGAAQASLGKFGNLATGAFGALTSINLSGTSAGIASFFATISGLAAAALSGPTGLIVAVIGAGIAVMNWVKSAMDGVNATRKLSRTFGITAEDAQAMVFALEHAGISADDLAGAGQMALRRFGELRRGTMVGQQVAGGLTALGLDPRAFAAANFNDQLLMLADGFGRIENASERASLAVAIMGRSGQTLLPFLQRGGEWAREAEALGRGFALTNEQVEAVTGALRTMKEAASVVTAIVTYFGRAAAVAVAPLFDLISRAAKALATDLAPTMRILATVFGAVVAGFVALNAAPILVPLALFAALVPILQAIQPPLVALWDAAKAVGSVLLDLAGAIWNAAKGAANLVGRMAGFVALRSVLTSVFGVIGEAVGAVWDRVKLLGGAALQAGESVANLFRAGAAVAGPFIDAFSKLAAVVWKVIRPMLLVGEVMGLFGRILRIPFADLLGDLDRATSFLYKFADAIENTVLPMMEGWLRAAAMLALTMAELTKNDALRDIGSAALKAANGIHELRMRQEETRKNFGTPGGGPLAAAGKFDFPKIAELASKEAVEVIATAGIDTGDDNQAIIGAIDGQTETLADLLGQIVANTGDRGPGAELRLGNV